ncbi:MAG: allulose-6-phosphate 3-epimerase [Clostridia bacterium]|nr:allulose-6-phosphate 3-epimerase [Clostridia bacterium]
MKNRPEFAPSLICMDLLRAGAQAEVINERAQWFHADLMDLDFVDNAGLGIPFVKAVATVAKRPVDCHLMVRQLDRWLPRAAMAGATMLTPHIEVTGEKTPEVLNKIAALGCKAGLAISPETPVGALVPYLDRVEKVTVMTIRPGFPGAPFLWETVEKIRELRAMRDGRRLGFQIEMDGSLSEENFSALREAGCDVFVAGAAALFARDDDLAKAFDKMEAAFGL